MFLGDMSQYLHKTASAIASNIHQLDSYFVLGSVVSIQGLLVSVRARYAPLSLGTLCRIKTHKGFVDGEVVGFEESKAYVMPTGPMEGIGPGAKVIFYTTPGMIYPHITWLGRTLDAHAKPIDDLGTLMKGSIGSPLKAPPPPPGQRLKVGEAISVGVRAMNTFLTFCKGQRMGIFAGSGVGKSTLMSMLARYSACDVCVIGLIGERGREVREFIEDTLGKEGLKKAIVVVATSDEPPLMRRSAAYTTMAIAESFRAQGKNVLCLMDSVTRFAMAQREIGLSAGEPPTTKGYPPSVFTELAKLLERAGPGHKDEGGYMSAFFNVLVDGDDHNEPIADAVRGILDGHVVMERSIAEKGQYPAINVLKSISRCVPGCHSSYQQDVIKKARQLLARYDDMADMISLGAYREGSDPEVDRAIEKHPALQNFLSQKSHEADDIHTSFEKLSHIVMR